MALDRHIELEPQRVEVDDDNRITSAPERLSLSKEEEVKPLLRLNASQEPTSEAVEARRVASRIEVGKRVTYNGSDRSVIYEIIDFDSLTALLARVDE